MKTIHLLSLLLLIIAACSDNSTNVTNQNQSTYIYQKSGLVDSLGGTGYKVDTLGSFDFTNVTDIEIKFTLNGNATSTLPVFFLGGYQNIVPITFYSTRGVNGVLNVDTVIVSPKIVLSTYIALNPSGGWVSVRDMYISKKN